MKKFDVELTTEGTNGAWEIRREFIIAKDWEEVCEMMAAICRQMNWVMMKIQITKTESTPFSSFFKK